MHVLYIIIMAVFLIAAILYEKNLYNPAVIFNATWLTVTFLASLTLYDLFSVTEKTYFIVFIGVCAFNLGFLCRKAARVVLHPNAEAARVKKPKKYEINYKILIPFFLVITLFTAYLSTSSIKLILAGTSMEVIRFNYDNIENGMVIRSAIALRFEMYVVAAAEFAAVALLPVVFYDKKSKQNIILLLELILFLVLHMFVTGARSFLIDVVFLFVIYIFMNFKKSVSVFEKIFVQTKKIPKFLIIIIAAGAIALVILMTFLRKGDRKETSIFREIYRYFAISFPLLEKHLELSASEGFTHGWTLLYGLIRPPLSMLHSVGVPFPPGLDNTMNLINANNDFYPVGGGKANSFVTVFYYHYMDFGIYSMLLYSFFYGYGAQCVYANVKRDKNVKAQTFYLLISIGLFLTFARSLFAAYRYVYAFFILAFAFKRQKKFTL